ncbi:hypothetical protein CALVIDRAFT_533124 [Calocera viscosa TUFC12733]|uniref:Protein YAE1 n=1 Tax=Calocera viscosa (strain TUFC12733) TaxID=1330018 RepID=A0A167RDD8_CALVF|nr:hypothetical protein CALVIDRAFT_533124 [Calocera viscosa TUFC12733]
MDDEDAWMDEDEMTEKGTADREWNSLADKYTNDGYREGITVGKEAHLQDGFDQGFSQTGVPVGRRLGNLRGTAAALLQYFTQLQSQAAADVNVSTQLGADLQEIKSITQGLAELQFREVAPRDAEAIAHAREHGIDDEEDAGDQLAKALGGMKTVDGQIRLKELSDSLHALLTKLGLQQMYRIPDK